MFHDGRVYKVDSDRVRTDFRAETLSKEKVKVSPVEETHSVNRYIDHCGYYCTARGFGPLRLCVRSLAKRSATLESRVSFTLDLSVDSPSETRRLLRAYIPNEAREPNSRRIIGCESDTFQRESSFSPSTVLYFLPCEGSCYSADKRRTIDAM